MPEPVVRLPFVVRPTLAALAALAVSQRPSWLTTTLRHDEKNTDPVALLLIVFLSAILCVGIRESSRLNMTACSLNMACILLVVLSGAGSVDVANLTAGVGGFLPFGMSGVFSAAGIVFFSFIGFDYIPNAAEEAVNPKRDVPRSIVTSLLVASVLYMGMASTMVLMQPYTDIDIAAPYKSAFLAQGKHLAAFVVSAGAVCGITTSTMTGLLANARLLAVLGRKRYLPAGLATIHGTTSTPVVATVLTGCVAGALAFLVDISVLTELVSAATLAIFSVVNCAALVTALKGVEDAEADARPLLTKAPLRLQSPPVAAICASPLVASALSRLTGSSATSMACVTLFVWLPACLKVHRGCGAPVGLWQSAFGILSTGFLFSSLHVGSLFQYAIYLVAGYVAFLATSRAREDHALAAYVADA